MFTEPMPREAVRICEELMTTGYCVVPGAVPAGAIASIDRSLFAHFASAPFESQDPELSRIKRIWRLLLRAPATEQLVRHGLILNVVENILIRGARTVQLNLAQGIARHPRDRAEIPFREQLMWRGSDNKFEYCVNVLWPLTPSRAENGAMRIWPGSHGSDDLESALQSNGISIELEPGDALLYLGSTLHSAGANGSKAVSRSITIGYCLDWLKPTENPWLAYPPEVARSFSPELQALVGYRQQLTSLGSFEGQCPSVLLDPQNEAEFALNDPPCIDRCTGIPAGRKLLS